MKLAGQLLLLAGWVIVLAAIVLLTTAVSRELFVLAGLGTEMLGLVLTFRSHTITQGEKG